MFKLLVVLANEVVIYEFDSLEARNAYMKKWQTLRDFFTEDGEVQLYPIVDED